MINDRLKIGLILAGIVVMGFVLRLYLFWASQGLVETDEAVLGLQAFGIMRGQRPIFYPGQAYSGSFESYLMALVFWIGGASPLTLKLAPLIFSLAFILLTYRLAADLYDQTVGLLSALFVAVSPLFLVVWSLKARGGFIEALALGNVVLILTIRILSPEAVSRRPSSLKPYVLSPILGFVAGLSLWINPLSLYYLIPAALVLLFKRGRAHPREMAVMAGGFVLGSAPLLLGNLAGGGPATGSQLLSGVVPAKDFWPALGAAMRYLVEDGLLTVWGVRPPKGELELSLSLAVVPAYVISILAALYLAVKRREEPSIFLALFLAFVPPIFALGALTNGNFTVIIPGSGLLTRYLLPLYSVVPIILAHFLARLKAGRIVILLLVAFVLAVNLWSVLTADPVAAMRSEFDNIPWPGSIAPLITCLEAEDIRYVYTTHWLGYRLMFETRERVTCFDYLDSLRHLDRLPEYSARVERAPEPAAYILFNPRWKRLPPLETRLQELRVGYEKKTLDDFLIYYALSRRVHPAEMSDTLVWPYY